MLDKKERDNPNSIGLEEDSATSTSSPPPAPARRERRRRRRHRRDSVPPPREERRLGAASAYVAAAATARERHLTVAGHDAERLLPVRTVPGLRPLRGVATRALSVHGRRVPLLLEPDARGVAHGLHGTEAKASRTNLSLASVRLWCGIEKQRRWRTLCSGPALGVAVRGAAAVGELRGIHRRLASSTATLAHPPRFFTARAEQHDDTTTPTRRPRRPLHHRATTTLPLLGTTLPWSCATAS